MSWDWEKLQDKRQRQGGGPPDLGNLGNLGNLGGLGDGLKKLGDRLKMPSSGLLPIVVLLGWALSGIFIVEPDEIGVVQRFGAFSRLATPGPGYHIPWPVESVTRPKVSQVQRVEVGFRTLGRPDVPNQTPQYRLVPEESLMLTGDENIVDVQFIVQYHIKDPTHYLFNVSWPDKTVKDASEAAMREVIGKGDIDSALTTGKLPIQNEARDLLQRILDSYGTGIRVVAVQLQDVHPPKDVVDAFKDVASAREDKSRLDNEAEAYRNDLLPRTRGEASFTENNAEAYKQGMIRKAQGEAARFTSVLAEYDKARDVTRERLYIETMETILGNPETQKIILTDQAMDKAVPYLPLEQLLQPRKPAGPAAGTGQPEPARGGKGQ